MPSFNGRKSSGNDVDIAPYLPFAQQIAYRHADRLKATGVTSGRWRVALPGGGFMVSIILEGGMQEIVLYPVAGQARPAQAYVIDYYSGIVAGGNLSIKSELQQALEDGEQKDPPAPVVAKLYSFYPNADTATKFPLHVLTEEELQQPVELRTWYDGFATEWVPKEVTKLAVRVYAGLESLADTAPIKYTGTASTYSHLRPTMFTGSMRKVVQFVMGIGKVLTPTWYLPLASADPAEQETMLGDRGVFNATAGYEEDGVFPLRYDFRFGNCYNVYKEGEGDEVVWWLVRVSQALGVIAMPLPVDALSATEEFRETLELMQEDDPSLPIDADLEVLDTFGGFPTGATFEPQVEAYIRAGLYIRLASVEELEGYIGATTWGDQASWAFAYNGRQARAVAYEDIALGGDDMCRAVRDLTLDIDITTSEPVSTGDTHARLLTALTPLLPSGEDTKAWHRPKIDRLAEQDAASLLVDIENAGTDKGKQDAVVSEFEMMNAVPLGIGTARLSVGGKWAFNPPAQLFKTAHLPYDMCPSVSLPANAILKEYGDYRSPGEGELVPLYRWFTEEGREMAIWFDGGATGSYQVHTNTTVRSTVEYQSRAPNCFVDEQPITMQAKDIYPGTYTEYKSGGQHHTTMGVSAVNDITPEGYFRADWLLRKFITGKDDGGPDKADLEYGSAYMVFGDAEAALEFNYHHHPATPAYTITYDRTTTGNSYSYDWNYNNGNAFTSTYRVVECWQTGPIFTGYPSYCSRPADDMTGTVPREWRKDFDYPVGKFTTSVIDGHWAKKGDVAAIFGGVAAPEIPPNENVAGTTVWSTRTTRIYAGGDVVSEYVDSTYVARDRAWLDILELQKSIYDPPPESPFIEHEVRGTRNSFGTESGSYMKAVNNYEYAQMGTQLHAVQEGDVCFVGVILDAGS